MNVKYIILTLIILIVLFLVFRQKKSEFKSEKTIWLLWLQGWDSAPRFVKQVKESWEKYNPEWNIKLLDSENLNNYIDVNYFDNVPTDAAKSDVIRLNLLEKHGGVWADSTMLCMAPLDKWLDEAIKPAGFWMWHGHGGAGCKGPASWFMVSQAQSIMIQKWKKACDEYWSVKQENVPYRWMDNLFDKLLENDAVFKNEWEKVPSLCCEDPGEAHMLSGRVHGKDPEVQNKLKENPPYALKLCRHTFVEDPNTNGEVAIKLALGGLDFKKHEMKF